MVNQQVIIEIKDTNGNDLGLLYIGASIDNELIEPIEVDDANLNEIIAIKNIRITTNPDTLDPIIILKRTDSYPIQKLMLLEETQYQVSFRSKLSINPNKGDMIFPTLFSISQNEIVVSEWMNDGGDECSYRCTLNFRSYVGKSCFDFFLNGCHSNNYSFEVRSKKIGYQHQYPAMISDIAEYCSSLILNNTSPLFQYLDFSDQKSQTRYEQFILLEYIFRDSNLLTAYEKIRKNPHSKLDTTLECKPFSLVSRVEWMEMLKCMSGGSNLCETPSGFKTEYDSKIKYIPLFINEGQFVECIDTQENRVIKDLLRSLMVIINDLLSDEKIVGSYIKDRLLLMDDIINEYLSDDWLNDVNELDFIPLNSQVLQKKEGYRELFQLYLVLEAAYKIKWDEIEDCIKGHNQRLSLLYEYWCYFKIFKNICEIVGKEPDFSNLFTLTTDNWSIRLKRGKESIRVFELDIDGNTIEIEFIYNRVYSPKSPLKSYSFPFRPDYSLIARNLNAETNQNCLIVHFDAKYRTDVEEANNIEVDELNIVEENGIKIPWIDDICKMHTYKDAILRTEGSYILYPGDTNKIYFEKINSSMVMPLPSIGAFPLTPGNNTNQENELKIFLKAVIDNLIRKSTIGEGETSIKTVD